MALIEEFNKSGNWLFKKRSFIPVVLYVFATIVLFIDVKESIPFFATFWWGIICIAVSMFGLLIRAFTIGFTPSGTSGRNTKKQVAENINTKGIYSVVRHPLYLGNLFMWLGIILFVGNTWFYIVGLLLFWIYYERIMFACRSYSGEHTMGMSHPSCPQPMTPPAVLGVGIGIGIV